MKAKFFTLVLAIVIMSFGLSMGQSITVSNVTGLKAGTTDTLMSGTTPVFTIHVNAGGTGYIGITNGFRIYSDDGAEWTTTVADTLSGIGWDAMFPLIFSINTFSTDGTGADTVGFGGSGLVSGLPPDFDLDAYTITIGPIPSGIAGGMHGKTICIDSTWYPPTGSWKWAGPEAFPSWDGPHCFTIYDQETGVEPVGADLPTSFALSQNYPNPFNPTTSISFDLPKKSDVVLSIYNITGQKVTEMSDTYEAGTHVFEWDASNMASGVYFYKLTAGDFTATKKMMLLK